MPKRSPSKKKGDKQHLPVFLPLDLFTVNLADRDAERYAQVGVTLELADPKTSDLLKAYMPAVRNDVLMLIAHKKAAELQDRAGKLELAREIRRVALKPLGTRRRRRQATRGTRRHARMALPRCSRHRRCIDAGAGAVTPSAHRSERSTGTP